MPDAQQERIAKIIAGIAETAPVIANHGPVLTTGGTDWWQMIASRMGHLADCVGRKLHRDSVGSLEGFAAVLVAWAAEITADTELEELKCRSKPT
jgi:hypothetical protein